MKNVQFKSMEDGKFKRKFSLWTDYEFPYNKSSLHTYSREITFQYQKSDKVIMEFSRLVAWRYKYLIEID